MDLETSLWPSWSAWVFTPSMGKWSRRWGFPVIVVL
jgi:hypothetical protein